MDGCPAEPTGLALDRGMPQSPDPPMGDLWGTMALFIGPGNKNQTPFTNVSVLPNLKVSSCWHKHVSVSIQFIDFHLQQSYYSQKPKTGDTCGNC